MLSMAFWRGANSSESTFCIANSYDIYYNISINYVNLADCPQSGPFAVSRKMGNLLAKIKDFWTKYERKIVLVVAFCLISAVSFGFGALWGQKWQSKPVIIEKLADAPKATEKAPESQNATSVTAQGAQEPNTQNLAPSTSKCAFVGSKNSDKFYVPTCSWAKRIKPENLACYPDEQAALTKGKIKSDCK